MKTILEYLINKSTKEKHIDLNKVPKDYNEFLEQIKEYNKKYNIELIYLYESDDKGNLTVKSKNYTFSRRIKRLRVNINDEYLVTTQQESTGRSITDPNKIDKYCEYAIYKAFGNSGYTFFEIVTTQAFLMLIMSFVPTPGAGLGAEGSVPESCSAFHQQTQEQGKVWASHIFTCEV